MINGSVSVFCMLVCLSARILPEIHIRSSLNFTLPMAFSGGVAIRVVLPVYLIDITLHIMHHMNARRYSYSE